MKFTKLTARHAISELYKSDGPEIVDLKAEEKKTGVTSSDTSNKITELFVKCRDLIAGEGPIYVEEETKAVKLALAIHANTKKIAGDVELIYNGLKKKWDDGEVKKLHAGVVTLRKLEAGAGEIKSGAVAHLDFRGNMPDGKVILGVEMHERLLKQFLAFRDAPMKEFMALADKWDKISEHRARGEHFLKLLPALKKSTVASLPKEGAMDQLDEDVQRFEKWMAIDGEFSAVKSKVGKLDGYLITFKAHKTKPVTDLYMKTAKTGLLSYQMVNKSLWSALKTAKLLKDGFLTKAGALAKDPKVIEKNKTIKTSYDEMESLLKSYDKKLKEVEKAYENMEELLAK